MIELLGVVLGGGGVYSKASVTCLFEDTCVIGYGFQVFGGWWWGEEEEEEGARHVEGGSEREKAGDWLRKKIVYKKILECEKRTINKSG